MKRVSVTEELAYAGALDRLIGGDKPKRKPRKRAATEPTATRRKKNAAKTAKPAVEAKVPMIKLSVFLCQEEDGYLESLASTAKFSGGKKISKTRLIEAMVRAFRGSKLDVQGVKSDEELLNRAVAQLRNYDNA